MVWLGDSTAAGVGAMSAAGSVPGRVAADLGRPVEVEVLAVSGATVADVLRVQAPRLAVRPGDVVVVSVGANDTTHLTPRGAFRRDYEKLLGVVPAGTEVVLLGVPDMGASPRLAQPLRAVAGWVGERLDAEIVALARRVGARYVDIAASTGPAFRRHPGLYFAADRYHPSDAGYRLWAREVLGALRHSGPDRTGSPIQSGH
jgi:lysophospholipase L1-like esterase